MTTLPGYPPVPLGGGNAGRLADAASLSWCKRIAEVVNNILKGKMNVVLPVTLANGAGTTIITDARIGPYSAFLFQPLTTHAAAALYGAPYVLVTDQKQGEATFAHVNDAHTDKNFNLVILG